MDAFFTFRGRLQTNVVVGIKEEVDPGTGVVRKKPLHYNVKFGQRLMGVFDPNKDIRDNGLAESLGISFEELKEKISTCLLDSPFFGKEFRIMNVDLSNIKLPHDIVREQNPEVRERDRLVKEAEKIGLKKVQVNMTDDELKKSVVDSQAARIKELESQLGTATEAVAREIPEIKNVISTKNSALTKQKTSKKASAKQIAALKKARAARKKKLEVA